MLKMVPRYMIYINYIFNSNIKIQDLIIIFIKIIFFTLMISEEIRNKISFNSLFNSLIIILTNKLFFYVKKQKIK